MIEACRAGWRTYLDDPDATNKTMSELNPDMDLETFTQAAAAQKSLVDTDETKTIGLGGMTAERWTTLGQQLIGLKVIKTAAPARECFVDVNNLK
jgi:NitT/TauT family transport system substrate-binding protein